MIPVVTPDASGGSVVSYHLGAETQRCGGKNEFQRCRTRPRPADQPGVNRSIWVIAGLGLFAAMALSMMMGRALRVREGRSAGPVAVAVNRIFGARLAAPAAFRAETGARGRVGSLALWPIPGINVRALASDAGATVWRELGRGALDALVVTCTDEDAEIVTSRFAVPAPWDFSAQLRELPAEPSAAPSAPAPPR